MALLPIDTATRLALARHLRFARRMAQLHFVAGRDGLGCEIAAAIAWDASAKELRAALQLARQHDTAWRERDTVQGSDPRD